MLATALLWLCAIVFGFAAVLAGAASEGPGTKGTPAEGGWMLAAILFMVIALLCAGAA